MMTSVGHKQELPLHALPWIGMQSFSAYLFDLVDLDFRHCERLVYAANCVVGFGVVVRAQGNWSSLPLRKFHLLLIAPAPTFRDDVPFCRC